MQALLGSVFAAFATFLAFPAFPAFPRFLTSSAIRIVHKIPSRPSEDLSDDRCASHDSSSISSTIRGTSVLLGEFVAHVFSPSAVEFRRPG